MRAVKLIHCLISALVSLSIVSCVEVIPEPTVENAEPLRTLPERLLVPRPADDQTWLVTTTYCMDDRDLDDCLWFLGDPGRTPVSMDIGESAAVIDMTAPIVPPDADERAVEMLERRPAVDLDDRKPVIELDEPEWVTHVERPLAGEWFTLDHRTPPELVQASLGECVSDSITWEFRVLDSDYVPHANSSIYELVLDSSGVPQRATLIEAVIYSEDDANFLAKDLAPVFRLVLRRSDYRLLALEVSARIDGRRISEIIDPARLGESDLTAELEANRVLLDFMLPEFPLDDSENQEMTMEKLDSGGVVVAFTSALDGSLVVQRWDAGQPWFTSSRSNNRFSVLGPVR